MSGPKNWIELENFTKVKNIFLDDLKHFNHSSKKSVKGDKYHQLENEGGRNLDLFFVFVFAKKVVVMRCLIVSRNPNG